MALWQLARRGVNAVGYDAFAPGHDRGAAGGESRILRAVPRRGTEYIPLLKQARELWGELEDETGERLMHRTGCATVGPADHAGIRAIQANAEQHGLPLENLDGAEAAQRVPEHPLRDGETLIVDPGGALIRPEISVLTAARHAEARGAQIHRYSPVTEIHDHGDTATIRTHTTEERYDRVIATLGPWAGLYLPARTSRLTMKQVTALWFARRQHDAFLPERTPVAMRVGEPAFSCCPGPDGAKVVLRDPSREASNNLAQHATAAVSETLPALIPDPIRASAYPEAYTDDGHPLLGTTGDRNAVIVGAGFSGHGFQLAPAFGSITADLALTGTTPHDITFMAPSRPLSSPTG